MLNLPHCHTSVWNVHMKLL